MVLPIVTGATTPILRTTTKPVPKVTKEILRLLKDMEETMIAADGVGIAAPQVNRSERVCWVTLGGKRVALVNPQIVRRSSETSMGLEGCLSLPGVWREVPRAVEIHLTYVDRKGKPQEKKLQQFNARVVLHEVDHLEGKLIVDY